MATAVRSRVWLAAGWALLGLAGACAALGQSAAISPAEVTPGRAATCRLEGAEARTVTRVLDGDTLQLDGGGEVRLVGALAPRAFDAASGAVDWPLAERARLELEGLVLGRAVLLAFAGRKTDRYGRLLAHVFLADPAIAKNGSWVQGEMLKRGMARAYALDGSGQCMLELMAHESLARETATGLWAETVYSVRSADDVVSLSRLAGTFQVVEGAVLRVSEVRGTTYINFGEDQRQDFTIVLRERVRREAFAAGLDAATLAGRRVRVRGWIERRGGPMIEALHSAVIELLSAGEEEVAAPVVKPRASRRR